MIIINNTWNRRKNGSLLKSLLIGLLALNILANNLAWGMIADVKAIESRAFEIDGKKHPIIFEVNDMLTTYIDKYNNRATPDKKINTPNCQVVGGIFTYYNAIPFGSSPAVYPRTINKQSNDYHNDGGWGCAWRASLNLLNKVKDWLAQNGIFPDSEDNKNRQVNMYDLAEWNKLNWHEWMEPAENAEMFLIFIKTWYPTHEAQILKLLGLRGQFYQGNQDKKAHLASSLRWKHVPLTNLRKYLELDDKTNHETTLNEFYKDCGSSSDITTDNFPQFNEKTHPFPLNIDDGIYARNIYGIHTEGNNIKHLFIGETHTGYFGFDQSPWKSSGWQDAQYILKQHGGNIMMLEIYLKAPLKENLLQLKSSLVTLKSKLETLKSKLTELKKNLLPKKVLLARTRGLINIGSNCYFNATLQCLAHLPALNDFLTGNKSKLDASALSELHNIFQEITTQEPEAYSGHSAFINECEKKFKTDNFESIVCGMFENVPPIMSQDFLNFAFVKEERIYEIANPKKTWNVKFTFGNYPILSAVCNVNWSGEWTTLDWLSRNKFTKDKTQRYNLPKKITKITCIQNVYDNKINLDPSKIKNEVEERIEATYNPKATPQKILPKDCVISDIKKTDKVSIFIDALKNEEFWTKFGLSPEEAKKLIALAPETDLTLSRKIIPPIILILPAENDYPYTIEIEQKYLTNKLNSKICYTLKAVMVGSNKHAWAYAKEQDGQWGEYDDAEYKLIGKMLPNEFKSLNFGKQTGYAQLVFYELDAESKPIVEQYYKLNPK